MIFSVLELVDIIIMVVIVGYLFKDTFKLPRQHADILDYYRAPRKADWHDFWFASALIAPSILIHELGHKFVAMFFGLDATFHAACSSQNLLAGNFITSICGIQLIAVVLKAVGVGFLIFVPAFVSIQGPATGLEHALIAFAGPFVHLVFWLGSAWMIKKGMDTKWKKNQRIYFAFFKQINMFLFILNIIPIPGFDGYKVFAGLLGIFF